MDLPRVETPWIFGCALDLSQVYTGNCKQFPEGEKRHGIGTYVARPALNAFESCCSMLLNVSPKDFAVSRGQVDLQVDLCAKHQD